MKGNWTGNDAGNDALLGLSFSKLYSKLPSFDFLQRCRWRSTNQKFRIVYTQKGMAPSSTGGGKNKYSQEGSNQSPSEYASGGSQARSVEWCYASTAPRQERRGVLEISQLLSSSDVLITAEKQSLMVHKDWFKFMACCIILWKVAYSSIE